MAGVPIAFRCGTEQEWNTHDPVLLAGELGLVLSSDPDVQLMKIGNGVNTWSALPWAARGPRGFDFEYSWDGTSLGVKHSDEASFTYVDLGMYFAWNGTKLGVKRGEDEAFTEQQLSLDFNWDGTKLGVKNPAATSFAYTGLGLQFNWDGHALGVKREEDAAYSYVNLLGETPDHQWSGTALQFENPDGTWGVEQELSPNFSWDGTRLGLKNPEAEIYTYQDLGLQYTWAGTELGVKNPDEAEYAYMDLKGEKGDKPAHQWDGTSLQFENPDGSQGSLVDLKGETGDPGVLSKGKIWLGNKNDVAEEADPPKGGGMDHLSVARKIMFYMRQYIGDEYMLPEERNYPPTANHDKTDTAQIGRNFRPLDTWITYEEAVSALRVYLCVDASSGQAVWDKVLSVRDVPAREFLVPAVFKSDKSGNKQSSAKERESRRKNLFYSL